MKKALIFDLDNCLAPAREIGEDLMRPVFAAIASANQEDIEQAVLQQAFAEMWRHPYDWVAEHFGFTDSMSQAGWDVLKTLEVTKRMSGYGDLPILKTLPGDKYLVTAGFSTLQQSKITALGLEQYFKELWIDAIDKPQRLGKQGLFASIIERHQYDASDVIVIGDNPDSEIAAGRALGLTTVQTLREGVPKTEDADHHVSSLDELSTLLRSILA